MDGAADEEGHCELIRRIEPEADPRKGIIVSRSFGRRITTLAELEEALATYVSRAGEKLRREKLLAKRMTVFMHTNPHATDRLNDPYHSPHCAFDMPRHTSHTSELISYAKRALRPMFKPGHRYMKCGVTLTDILQEGFETRHLFNNRDPVRDARLMQALDSVNRSQGANTVFFAAADYRGYAIKSD